jgi:hypothetical protein
MFDAYFCDFDWLIIRQTVKRQLKQTFDIICLLLLGVGVIVLGLGVVVRLTHLGAIYRSLNAPVWPIHKL